MRDSVVVASRLQLMAGWLHMRMSVPLVVCNNESTPVKTPDRIPHGFRQRLVEGIICDDASRKVQFRVGSESPRDVAVAEDWRDWAHQEALGRRQQDARSLRGYPPRRRRGGWVPGDLRTEPGERVVGPREHAYVRRGLA